MNKEQKRFTPLQEILIALTAVAILVFLFTSPANAAEVDPRIQDCFGVARFYALVFQGEDLIVQGNEEEGESFIIRAKRVRLDKQQQRLQRQIRSSITNENYLNIYRTCWDGYFNFTANPDPVQLQPETPTLGGQVCICPKDEEILCEDENFDS